MSSTIVQYLRLPLHFDAYTMLDKDGTFVIIINSNLSSEVQDQLYQRELTYISTNDFEHIIDVANAPQIYQ